MYCYVYYVYVCVDVELLEKKLVELNAQIGTLKTEAMSQTTELDELLDMYEKGVRKQYNIHRYIALSNLYNYSLHLAYLLLVCKLTNTISCIISVVTSCCR